MESTSKENVINGEIESSSEEKKVKDAVDENREDSHLMGITIGEEYIDQKKVSFLDYERQMFLDVLHSDGLVVCGKGISYDKVLVNLMRAYSDAGNLILVINSSEPEEKFYKSQIEKKFTHEVATSVTERERVYLEGGIQFITTRILVVDLLKKRIPIELITGIIVMRAHTIIESCQEAFALRLFRQSNKTGFIKAFSSSAEAFTIGYGHVERTMRNLFVKELYLWPRFHATVKSSLKSFEAPTIELHVRMTEKMSRIQIHILDIMNYLVQEVKRINRTVDMAEITVENCVTKKFHKILQAQLDCIWHQLNSQTKLIVSDLKVLRNLMLSTIYSDSVSGYALIKRYRTTEYALSNSGWTLLDAADSLFKIAKERVFNEEQEFSPEPCAKWAVLNEILRAEIPNEIKQNTLTGEESAKVLILCQDNRTCFQLNQFLIQGGEKYLLYMAMKHDIPITKLSEIYKNLNEAEKINKDIVKPAKILEKKVAQKRKIQSQEDGAGGAKDEETKILLDQQNEDSQPKDDELSVMLGKDEDIDVENFRHSYFLTLTQPADNETSVSDSSQNSSILDVTLFENSEFEQFPEMENLDLTSVVTSKRQPIVCIQTFKTEQEGLMALDRTLNELNPRFVIMYHTNVTAIRQIEVYEARKKRPRNKRVKIFFLLHLKTVEEQSFLTSLRREKQSFELLIDTKRSMLVPEYQDGKTDEAFLLTSEPTDDSMNANIQTRNAGGQGQIGKVATGKIVVDMREFRSDLPCLIHKRGIAIVPVTITIGDYILSPDICVERKSISDLIGSLNSGRLYNQCIQMQRFYSKPILLIEFDQNKPFHLQGKYMLSGDSKSSNSDIVQKLQLLTLHFPKLRLIWSPNPYATAELFEELKDGKEQPDPEKCAAIGADSAGISESDKYNPNIFDFMIRLPGISSKNIFTVMRNVKNLKELLKKSEEDLSKLLGSASNAKMLWDILQNTHKPTQADRIEKVQKSKFGWGRGKRF